MRRVLVVMSCSLLMMGCGRVPEPACVCPRLTAIDAAPRAAVTVRPDGSLDANDTARLFGLCRRLRIEERYYMRQIGRYNDRFARKTKEKERR